MLTLSLDVIYYLHRYGVKSAMSK